MKQLVLTIMLGLTAFTLVANDYEPEKIFAELHTDVTMVFENMDNPDLGVTAVQTNSMPGLKPGQDLIIKSFNDTLFKVTRLVCVSMVQALDVEDKEVAYMVQLFTVKEGSIEKMNSSIKENQVQFFNLIDSLDDEDLTYEMHGSQNAPDPKDFVKLRNLQVYDIYVTTDKDEEIHLQVYVEFFRDSEELD